MTPAGEPQGNECMSTETPSGVPSQRFRLFLALPPPEGWRLRAVRKLRATLRHLPDVRVIPPENWHLTLLFFGEQRAADRDAIRTITETLPPTPEVPLLLDRFAVWPQAGVAVLTARSVPSEWLDYQKGIVSRFTPYLQEEKRGWLPHLTLMRRVRKEVADPHLPPCRWAHPILPVLYCSHLDRNGARYEALTARHAT